MGGRGKPDVQSVSAFLPSQTRVPAHQINTMQTELLSPEDTTDLASMPTADSPAVWEGYRANVGKLKATAETLEVTDISQVAEMKLARQTRLALRSIRLDVEKHRKQLGEVYLRKTQKINGEAKAIRDAIESLEARLEDQEKFAERKEQERLIQLGNERHGMLMQIGDITMSPAQLAEMDEEMFNQIIQAKREAADAAQAEQERIEQERTAAEKAARLERMRMDIENKRLRKEAEAKEAELAQERAERDAERRAAESKAEADRHESARIAAAAQAAKDKAEAELQAKRAEEARIAAESEIARKRAESAPDREKLNTLAAQVRGLDVPALTCASGQEIQDLIHDQIAKFAAWIERTSEKL